MPRRKVFLRLAGLKHRHFDSPRPAPKRSLLDTVRAASVTIAAGLWAALGTIWTIFAWYHQEVVVPSTAPVNLATEMVLEDVGSNTIQTGQFEAIQLSVTATNVSGRNIYFLSNYWDAWAGEVKFQPKQEENLAWLRDVNQLEELQAQTGEFFYSMSGRYYKISKLERIAWGNIFPHRYFLYPKETVSASVVFYVPKGSYDLIHVELHLPTTAKQNSAQIRWVVEEERIEARHFKITSDGKAQEVFEKADIDALEIQETQARKQLTLWPRNDARSPAKSEALTP